MSETWIASETPVSALMADTVVKVTPDATLIDVVDALVGADVGVVGVVEHGRVLGVISERDVVRALSARSPLDTTHAIDIATKDLAWCDAEATVSEVAIEMAERYIRHVLVERDGKLVGMVSARDLVAFYASEDVVLDQEID